MKCPHCLTSFHDKWDNLSIGSDVEASWYISRTTCPECGKLVVILGSNKAERPDYLVRPKAISRSPIPKEVPGKYAVDYKEACMVLGDSPKASAALSRRCLQNILREIAKAKLDDLSKEIQEVIDSGKLPSDLSEAIDAIRNIGNFAAHPIKSQQTGLIADVEPGEAEWGLDVIEDLFDFYFVRPERIKAKKDALNKKLKEAGKPEMK